MKQSKIRLYKDKLKGHKDSLVEVYSPQGNKGGLLVSISRDCKLKVWNLFERELVLKKFLNRHSTGSQADTDQKVELGSLDMVESVLFNDKTVFCGFGDGSIYAWNMKEGTLIYHFEGHDDKITTMLWLGPDTFCTSSFDSTVIFWDALNGVSTCVMKLQHEINQMMRLDDRLYCLCNYKELNVISIAKKEIELKIEFSEHTITSILATRTWFLFGDSYSHLYSIRQEDLWVRAVHQERRPEEQPQEEETPRARRMDPQDVHR